MSKFITASINCTKIEKAKLIKGKKGTYLNLTIWINDEKDQYGNDVSIEQKTQKGESKIYLGNGRFYKGSELPVADSIISEEQEKEDDLAF